jgi:NAD(P)-dependent dehydrogenase (short-subunit alcohol dehydrogenase family)
MRGSPPHPALFHGGEGFRRKNSMPQPLRVMITAAASGIGRAIAQSFAAEGARVHICDVDEAALKEFRADNPRVAAARVDVSRQSELDGWFDMALADLGRLDVLINNAGTKGPTAFVEEIAYGDWRDCLAVCLDAQFLCARRAVPLMKQQKSGSIINLSSVAGLVGFGMRSPYAAAKWAVIGFTKSLAIELGPHNVRVNAICPGTVKGDRIDRVIGLEAQRRGISFDEVAQEYISGQSIKRYVEPSEIADLCLFLASPAAKMITGQAIAVDGHTETYHIG